MLFRARPGPDPSRANTQKTPEEPHYSYTTAAPMQEQFFVGHPPPTLL